MEPLKMINSKKKKIYSIIWICEVRTKIRARFPNNLPQVLFIVGCKNKNLLKKKLKKFEAVLPYFIMNFIHTSESFPHLNSL